MKNKILYIVSFLLFFLVGFGVCFSPVTSDAAVVKVGDTLTIGHWEQDGESTNGAEAITWSVVSMREGKAVLLSDHILDMVIYSESDALWSKSYIRTWLNDTFYNAAFSDSEKSFIEKKKNRSRVADKLGFESTEDFVYILSESEAKGYKDIVKSLSAKPTAHTLKKGLFVDQSSGYGYWWLRTPGSDTQHAAYTNPDGSLYVAGCKTTYSLMGGVRPVIQIDLNKSGFGGYKLTVNYLYSNGKTAATSYIAGITAGEKYDIKSPAINGCVPDKTSVSGVMGNSDLTVNVVYKSASKTARKISAPVKASGDSGKVVLKPVNPNGYGYLRYGYSLKNDINTVSVWTEGREFTGLVGGNTYYFFARVTGSTVYEDAFSSGTAIYVDKTDRTIAAPHILNVNHNAVAGLEITPNGGGSVVYGVSASDSPGSVTNWSNYPVFGGLSSGVKYYLFAKVAETDNFKSAYSKTEFTTASAKNATEIPCIKTVTESSIEVIPVEMLIGKIYYGIAVSPDVSVVKDWTAETVFNGLEKGKRYYIFTKIEDNSMYTGSAYSYSSAVTVSGVRNVVIPEIESVAGVTITVKPVTVGGSDFVYFGISLTNNASDISVWQTSNVFDDLLPDTEYHIFAKRSNGKTSDDIISNGVPVRTASIQTDAPNTNLPQNTNTKQKESISAWWIVLMVIAVTALICSGVYILVKKKIIFKNFDGFGKLKAVFTTAFKSVEKDNDDKYIDEENEPEDQEDDE